MSLVALSHRLTTDGPNWPGCPGLAVQRVHDGTAAGEATTHLLTLFNHYGTHVDLAGHFLPGGATIDDHPIEDFVFDRPALLEIVAQESTPLRESDVAGVDALPVDTDLLLLRSGFESWRSDTLAYSRRGPGLSVAAAQRIRSRLPRLRAVGIDWLSACAFADAANAGAIHEALLTPTNGISPMIFEDMSLAALTSPPRRVWALPLLVAGIDGSPCTIVAEL